MPAPPLASRVMGAKSDDLTVGDVQGVGAQAVFHGIGSDRAPAEQLVPGDEVHGNLIFENGDIGLLQNPGHQDVFHLLPGHIVGMNDAAAGMAAFPGEIEVGGGVGGQIKVGSQVDQFPDAFRSGADHLLHSILVAQPVARGQGVFDVQVKAVIGAEYPQQCLPGARRVLVSMMLRLVMTLTEPWGATLRA